MTQKTIFLFSAHFRWASLLVCASLYGCFMLLLMDLFFLLMYGIMVNLSDFRHLLFIFTFVGAR